MAVKVSDDGTATFAIFDGEGKPIYSQFYMARRVRLPSGRTGHDGSVSGNYKARRRIIQKQVSSRMVISAGLEFAAAGVPECVTRLQKYRLTCASGILR